MKKLIFAALFVGVCTSGYAKTIYVCGALTTVHGDANTTDTNYWVVVNNQKVQLQEMLDEETRNPYVRSIPMEQVDSSGSNCLKYKADGLTAKLCDNVNHMQQSVEIEEIQNRSFAWCQAVAPVATESNSN